MSVYNYSKSNGKTSFNISFRSINTDSYTGASINNAKFFVDLRGIIDTDDFKKSYKVYLSFNLVGNGGTGLRNVIMTATLQIGTNPTNALLAGRESITSGKYMLFTNYYNSAAANIGGLALIPYSFCRFEDNAPLFLKNLYNTDYVNIILQNQINNYNQNFRYVFILRFEECD